MAKSLLTPIELLSDPPLAPPELKSHLGWAERRDRLRAQLQRQPPAGIGGEEVEAHFSGMPAHYWERVTEGDLAWGLETIHGFLQLVTAPNVPATTPIVNWRQAPHAGGTRVMLCTWDRHGLLAKAAAAFSAVRLNILTADVFTRTDNVVLDVFCVADADTRGPATLTRLQEMNFLLEGALSEPPRFASVWACSRHKFLAPPAPFPPRIAFDNQSSPAGTTVRVEAPDRLGLLYDILQTLADGGLSVTQARIETEEDLARDVLHVTDARGQKVLDPGRLEELRRRLEAALTVRD
jgi:[protein-PII] uridylyltransferase